ncbi:MAG: WYL domain-containing protein [archaeon]
MTKKQCSCLELPREELLTLYRALKSNEGNYSESYKERYNDYYDEYEKPISKKVIQSILQKISSSLPEKEIEEIKKEFLRRKYHTYNNEIDEKVYATLKKALAEQKTVAIEYFDMDSAEFIPREIDVYHTTARYTEAYCHLRKENRTFKTSRITKAKISNKKYALPNKEQDSINKQRIIE